MAQSEQIVAATKRALRRQGLTYADVAHSLGLSEASVKRLFARGGFSLERLEAIADLLGCELSELMKAADTDAGLPDRLSHDQEAYLVERPKLFLTFYLLLNGYDLPRITREYRIDHPEGILLLRELERLDLIEHQPGDEVRLRVARELSWRRDGPIRRFIDDRVLREFLGAEFNGNHDAFHFRSGLVSAAALGQLQAHIDRVVRRFNEQLRHDASTALDERQGCSLLIALRPWRFSLFEDYRRDSESS